MFDNKLQMGIMVVIIIFILILLTNTTRIRLHPDCNLQPQNADCTCYNQEEKISVENGFNCKLPSCYKETVNKDCGNLAHIMCVGQWNCIQNSCAWTCTK